MEDSRLKQNRPPLAALIKLVKFLRSEDGCPWDRTQTPQTIAVYLIEEVYELVEAIESGSPEAVCEELGDVLFQIIFLAAQYDESGQFTIEDVARGITEKMIRRHPHVFGETKVATAKEVPAKWQAIKAQEKEHCKGGSLLDSIPVGMPALMRAYRISERAAGAGFDWKEISGVMQKAEEEWFELKAELEARQKTAQSRKQVALEFGDILFTLVNVARFARIHPETALVDAIRKFEKRFRALEKMIRQTGQEITSVPHTELQDMWEAIKGEENGSGY